jgi:hypothetical protein
MEISPVGTLQTGYPRVHASSQDKKWGVQPCAAMCPVTSDPASQLRWDLRLPRVQRLRNLPPSQGGLWCCHVSQGTRPIGRALEHHMSHGSRSCLPAGRAPSSHASSDPLWAVGLKHEEKPSRPACAAGLACSQRTHVSKVPDVRAIMSLQDMQADTAASACKMWGQTATVQR